MSDAQRRRSADIREFESATVVSELIQIAEYITHMRDEISALRANEMTRDRIPMAHEELGSVLNATAGATNRIMNAAESILSLPDGPEYRSAMEEHIGTIFEACAFQDITGQRISKVVSALQSFEQRLDRFIGAVRARDSAISDPTERARRERASELMLNGPQAVESAPSQDDIDALFA
ncbi:protein phosphatase CheZ [Methylobacterium sp. NFXW15]|uniref:protein phosphatase CheZ n=1 Tax=Methylobacterium sp. NFXW15 TaxID=2819512 RepID=UPI003CEABD24